MHLEWYSPLMLPVTSWLPRATISSIHLSCGVSAQLTSRFIALQNSSELRKTYMFPEIRNTKLWCMPTAAKNFTAYIALQWATFLVCQILNHYYLRCPSLLESSTCSDHSVTEILFKHIMPLSTLKNGNIENLDNCVSFSSYLDNVG